MLSLHPTVPNPLAPWAYSEGFRLLFEESLEQMAEHLTRSVWSPNVFKNGKRSNDNFACSFFLSMDFDNGKTTLRDAGRLFCDYKGIIGTTKSHQVVSEKNPRGVDRFRVVIPWEKPVNDPVVYAYNMELIMDKYDCDASCGDLARFYFPCKDIVAVTDGEDYYSYTVAAPTPEYLEEQKEVAVLKKEEIERAQKNYLKYGKLKGWHERFLNKGILPDPNASRHWVIFSIAFNLYLCGARDEDIYSLLVSGNYDKTGLTNLSKVIEGRMKSAKKKAAVVLASLET